MATASLQIDSRPGISSGTRNKNNFSAGSIRMNRLSQIEKILNIRFSSDGHEIIRNDDRELISRQNQVMRLIQAFDRISNQTTRNDVLSIVEAAANREGVED